MKRSTRPLHGFWFGSQPGVGPAGREPARISASRQLAAAASILGLLLGQIRGLSAEELCRTWSAAAPRDHHTAEDVRLSAAGSLRGRVVRRDGIPQRGSQVILQTQRDPIPRFAITDSGGYFVIPGLRTGVVSISSGSASRILRVWSPETAPPSAEHEICLYDFSEAVVRGQQPLCNMAGCEPLMIGVLAAAAIAIPLALHRSGDDTPASE